MLLINTDELRKSVEYLKGEQKDKLITFIDMCEAYAEVDVFDVEMRKSIYTFNRAKKPLVKESFHSPKITRWTKKNTKHLTDAIGNGEGFEGFRTRSGLTETTDQAIRTRMYKIGYCKDEDGEWITK